MWGQNELRSTSKSAWDATRKGNTDKSQRQELRKVHREDSRTGVRHKYFPATRSILYVGEHDSAHMSHLAQSVRSGSSLFGFGADADYVRLL